MVEGVGVRGEGDIIELFFNNLFVGLSLVKKGQVMSKKPEVAEQMNEDTSYSDHRRATKEIEGKLLTIIDATFNDKEQRNAQKSIIRNTIWDWSSDYWNYLRRSKGSDQNPITRLSN